MLRHPAVSVSAHRQQLLAERARSMRLQMTASEAALWQCLSGKQLGVAFRRQVVIGGNHIADFAAPAVRVIVEVDGAYHRGRAAADARRDRKLRRLGWRVVRVEAEVVLRNLPAAVGVIGAAIAAKGC
jgi:very-short-patch-repair endonuclease